MEKPGIVIATEEKKQPMTSCLCQQGFEVHGLFANIKSPLQSMQTPALLHIPARGSDVTCHSQIIGCTQVMRQLKAYLLKVARTESTVLITGETGTGKELAAEAIHQNSGRQTAPFLCINCAALPENLIESELFGYDKGAFTGAAASKPGSFELANEGTVFLDEIGDMSLNAQVKILRTIERKEIYRLGSRKCIPLNVRVIAATNQNLETLIQGGQFRADLYHRLNVARIHFPPLRDRKEDLPLLIAHYIQHFNQQFHRSVEGLDPNDFALLLQYDWPGNIRELKNFLEASFINLPPQRVKLLELPEFLRAKLHETAALPPAEREQILAALFATNWNKSKAAEQLHWCRMTLYRKMAKYDIKSD